LGAPIGDVPRGSPLELILKLRATIHAHAGAASPMFADVWRITTTATQAMGGLYLDAAREKYGDDPDDDTPWEFTKTEAKALQRKMKPVAERALTELQEVLS
jgi:hypothetical protein